MRKVLLLVIALFQIEALGQVNFLTDEEIRHLIVKNSREEYLPRVGSCVCPYDTRSNGTLCLSDSAYSRSGVGRPICFVSDVSSEMILAYRQDPSRVLFTPTFIYSGHPATNVVVSPGRFVYQGIHYHPLSNGCANIMNGTPLNAIHRSWVQSTRGSYVQTVLFALPDGSHCLAMPLHSSYF